LLIELKTHLPTFRVVKATKIGTHHKYRYGEALVAAMKVKPNELPMSVR
jgi:hypothetical protein